MSEGHPGGQFDLNQIANAGKYDVHFEVKSSEISSERASRLRIEEAEARHRRLKELITLVTFVVGLAAIGITCLVILCVPGVAPEQRQWASGGLSAILAGATGYLAGRPKGG